MKNIIVTGGSGFIGSNLVNLLIKKKFNVTILDKKRPKNCNKQGKKVKRPESFEYIEGSVG